MENNDSEKKVFSYRKYNGKKKYPRKKPKCYDIQDVIKNILKKDRIVDEKTYGHVVKQYFQNIVDALFEYSTINLPYGMGILRFYVIDCTPYYDVKKQKVVGGVKIPSYLKGKVHDNCNKLIKVSYNKGVLKYNPFRFFKFERSRYMEHKIGEQYKNKNFNSLYVIKN